MSLAKNLVVCFQDWVTGRDESRRLDHTVDCFTDSQEIDFVGRKSQPESARTSAVGMDDASFGQRLKWLGKEVDGDVHGFGDSVRRHPT